MFSKEKNAVHARNVTRMKQIALELFDKKNITVDREFEEKLKTTKAYTEKVDSMFI